MAALALATLAAASCAERPSGTTRLDRAIDGAVRTLLGRQDADGRWNGIGTFTTPEKPDAYGFTAAYALLLEHLDADEESRRRAIAYLVGSQQPDGGWGDTSANFGGLLALQRAGFSADSVPVRRALDGIARRGETLDRANALIKLFHALHGRYAWDRVTSIAPLSSVDAARQTFERTRHYSHDVGASIAILKTIHGGGTRSRAQLEAIKGAESLLLARQLPTGSWFEYAGFTIMGALALYELGHVPASPPIGRAIAYLRTLQRPSGVLPAFAMPITETVVALLALEAAGLTIRDEPVRRAVQFLVDSRMPGGGWGYTPALRVFPDWDDVALAYAAIGPWVPTAAASIEPYAFSLQNSDGGWATFSRDSDPSLAYVRTMPLNEHAILTWDPSLPDITGHMLLAFGRLGHRLSDPRLRKSRDYLRRVQFDNGMWFGYWGIAYLYGTTQVLLGLEAVGDDMSAPDVARAVRWLKDRQQAEGCWGETLRAMGDPAHAGRGPCTAVQTAWVLLGLLAAGERPESPAVDRAARWLLDRQRADGSWPVDRVLFGHVVEYHLPYDGITWPLWALAKYRAALHR